MDPNSVQEGCYLLEVLDSFQPIKLLKISGAVLDKQWKFAELIGDEALLEMSRCFAHYAAFQCNTDFGKFLHERPSSPKWIVRGIAASVLNRSSSSFHGSPFVEKLLSVIKHVDSEIIQAKSETLCQCLTQPSLPRSVAIVMEGADVSTVVDLALQLVFLPPHYKNCQDWILCAIFVQESLVDELVKKLVTKCRQIVMSGRLNKTDDQLFKMVEEAKKVGAEVEEISDDEGTCSAAIIYNFTSEVFQLVKPVPILNILPFRDAAEGSKLASSMGHFCAASVWGGDVSKCMEIADNLNNCTTIWLNSHGRTHPGVTVCSQLPCRLMSARDSRVNDRNTANPEVLAAKPILKFDPLNTFWKLLELKEMEPYRGVILRWTSINTPAVPNGLSVIGKIRGPIGKVVIRWKYNQDSLNVVNLIAASLACSNMVFVAVDDCDEKLKNQNLVAAMATVVPQGMLRLLQGNDHPVGAGYVVHACGSTRDLLEPEIFASDQDVLWQLARCQYIWIG